MKFIRLVLVAAVAMVAADVLASPTSIIQSRRRGRDESIKPGRWHANLEKCKEYCVANGCPLVAVWSNGDACSHCLKLENDLNEDYFYSWQKTSGIVFYFAVNGEAAPEGTPNGASCRWCANNNTAGNLPFVRIWWPKKNVDVAIRGDDWDNGYGYLEGYDKSRAPYSQPGDPEGYISGARYCKEYLVNKDWGKLRKWSTAPEYYGGSFAVPDDRYAGLQAVLGVTTFVDVPLIRTNETALAKAGANYTNVFVAAYSDGYAKTNRIVWANGQASMNFAMNLKTGHITGAGVQIALSLIDENNKGKVMSTTHVTVVSAEDYPNSPKNPFWIGERSADGANGVPTLSKGEWTMDIDVLTNRVNAYNATRTPEQAHAYAMVLIGGSCWCPDCAMADKWLFDQEDFKTWARNRKVFFGVVDIPASPTSAPNGRPSLLTYVSERASDAFVTCRGTCAPDETQRIQSGTAYLSRHSIPQTGNGGVNATAIIERNKVLAKEAYPKGFNMVDKAADGKERPGVPQLVLLRADGTIAARWRKLSDYGPEGWNANYLKRLDEMIDQVRMEEEEANDSWRTTKGTVKRRGITGGTPSLSHTDLVDVYKVDADAAGQVVNFKVRCAKRDPVDAKATIFRVTDGTERVLDVQEGSFTNEISVMAEISGTCYLRVEAQVVDPAQKPGTPVSDYLSATSAASTLSYYFIESSNVLVPSSLPQVEKTEDPVVTISVEKGLSYKMTNVKVDENGNVTNALGEAVFVGGATPGIFVAQATDAIKVTLDKVDETEQVYITEYQIWETGQIGFAMTRDAVKETGVTNTYRIAVMRKGGKSGRAACSIYLDKEKSDALWDGTVFDWPYDGLPLTWEEGKDETQYVTVKVVPNEFWDGQQKLVFTLTQIDASGKPMSSDAGLELAEFELTIVDNDVESPGTIAFYGDELGTMDFAKEMTVVAETGSTVQLCIGRFLGGDGRVTTALDTTGGTLSEQGHVWDSRCAGVDCLWRPTLDLTGCTPGKDVLVKLVPEAPAKLAQSRSVVRIKVTTKDSPAFNTVGTVMAEPIIAVANIPLAHYTEGISTSIELVNAPNDPQVTFYSGQLPPGVRWTFADGKLTLSGTPAKGGDYSAVFRAWDGEREGLTGTILFKIFDPTVDNVDYYTANHAVEKARTVQDIIVVEEGVFRGLLTVTVPKSGRLSAKFSPVNGDAISLFSQTWDDFDEKTGTLTATLDAVAGDYSLTVDACANGTFGLVFKEGGDELDLILPAGDWSQEKNGAARWVGQYNVSLPQSNDCVVAVKPFASGAGYVILKMDETAAKSARMTYAGLLPNGKSFSGTGTLVPFAKTEFGFNAALLPFVNKSSADELSGIFSIKPDAAENYKTVRRSVFCLGDTLLWWRHIEPCADASYETALDAFGGIYDQDEDISVCCSTIFEGKTPYFFAQQELLAYDGSPCFGRETALRWSVFTDFYTLVSRSVRVYRNDAGNNKIKLYYPEDALSIYGLVLTFDRTTGLVYGSFEQDFGQNPTSVSSSATVTFRGVVMPGWGTSCAEGCRIDDAAKRPFISGPCWFSDVFSYKAAGRDRVLQVKRGFPFSVGLEAGF